MNKQLFFKGFFLLCYVMLNVKMYRFSLDFLLVLSNNDLRSKVYYESNATKNYEIKLIVKNNIKCFRILFLVTFK